MVQWLRLSCKAGDTGLILVRELRSYIAEEQLSLNY